MKVLYLVHQFYPEFQAGTEKFVFNCASMTQKNGIKAKVITYNLQTIPSFPSDRFGVLFDEYFYEGLNVLAYRYTVDPGDLHFNIDPLLGTDFAKETLRIEKPDLIHAGHLMRTYPFIIAAMELGIPYILTLTDFHLLCPKIILAPTPTTLCSGPEGGKACSKFCGELPESFIQNRLELTKKILLNARAVVSPSNFLADIFEREVPGLRVIVNNHGIRQSNLHIKHKTYHRRDNINFGFIGFVAAHKGVHLLIKAFNGLDSEKASLKIYGGGSADYLDSLHNLAGKGNVEFSGPFHSSDLPDVLDQIDVLVTPSLNYENYPFSLHEALAYEVPVIASDLGGMKERIVDNFNGFTFPPGDAVALTSIMQKIVDEPELLNQLKANIRIRQLIPTVEQEMYTYRKIYYDILVNSG